MFIDKLFTTLLVNTIAEHFSIKTTAYQRQSKKCGLKRPVFCHKHETKPVNLKGRPFISLAYIYIGLLALLHINLYQAIQTFLLRIVSLYLTIAS